MVYNARTLIAESLRLAYSAESLWHYGHYDSTGTMGTTTSTSTDSFIDWALQQFQNPCI